MSDHLKLDGFYCTGPVPWEDWHAGVRLHGIRFFYTRYYPNGDWLSCYRDHEFEFWAFTESVTPELLADAKADRSPRIADADPLCTAGSYTIASDKLIQRFTPASTGGMTLETAYQILDDRLLFLNPEGHDVVWQYQPSPDSNSSCRCASIDTGTVREVSEEPPSNK